MKKIMFLLVVALGVGIFYQQQLAPKKQVKPRAKPIVSVVVSPVTLAEVRDEVEALGTTRANESVTLTSKVSNIITSINFDDGDVVRKGDVLLQLQSTESEAKVKVAQLSVIEHQREYQRIITLVTNQTVAELERDRLQTLIDTAQAELVQAQAVLADHHVKAPFSGRLGLRQVSVGSFVTPGTTITTLDDISTIKLDFSVPERFLQQLSIGKVVESQAVAFADEVFSGKVSSIDSRVNPVTRSVIVRAAIPNKDRRLRPGMLMKVRLIKQSRQALRIPEAAIIPIQNKHYVYVVNAENVVERKEVHVGLRTRGWVEITHGLSVDEQVITRGTHKVRPGGKVSIKVEEAFTLKRNQGELAA